MLDQEFCEFLEYELCKAFSFSGNEDVKGFWCDGVLLHLPSSYYSQQQVSKHKQLLLKAFIGKTGQDSYELCLKFGKKALSRLARNLDIKESVPNPTKPDYFLIDTKRFYIEIQLD